jgi:hypothetical protein
LKWSRFAAVFVIVAMLLAAFPVRQAQASQPYSEKVTVYIAGSDALWFMTFGGVNMTSSRITAVEAIQGVNWYNVTALNTASWTSDFQIFGQNGYNLIPVPLIPSQGAFLNVGAANYSVAASAAAGFDSYLLASFASYANSSGSYTFYSPLAFKSIIPSTLLRLIPTEMGGFASAVSSSALAASASPIVSLQGERESSGFSHNLTIGSIAANALSASSQPNLLKYFGTSISSLRAANKSVSSVVTVRFLDGVIKNEDSAAIASSSGGSGVYSLSLAPGKSVKSLNVTVVQQPPVLLAQRIIDKGVLTSGQNVSVSISLTNLSANTTITTSAFSDDWWQACGCLRLVSSTNSSIPSDELKPGGTFTPTYVLQYNGNESEQVSAPATEIVYSFEIGTAEFQAWATLNPIMLSLSINEPVVFAYVSPKGTLGASVGENQTFDIVASNVGTLTASSVVVAGQSVAEGIIPGSAVTIPITLEAQSMLETNYTHTYTVSYMTPGGQQVSVSTNTMPFLFSHSSMHISFMTIAVSADISPLASGMTNLTVIINASNEGSSPFQSFRAVASLPEGLACGTRILGAGLTCTGGVLSLSNSSIAVNKQLSASIQFDLASKSNYVFRPIMFAGVTAGMNLKGASSALAVPTGVVFTKQFASTDLFSGMTTEVTLNAVNSGPFDIYNATIASSTDSFDNIPSSYLPEKFVQTIAPGKNSTVFYPVTANATYGSLAPSNATMSLFFGGAQFTLTGSAHEVEVYGPVTAAIKTSSTTLIEGKTFSLNVTLTNPSGVNVTDVQFILPIPGSMSLSNLKNAAFSKGNLNVSIGLLAPHGTYSASVSVLATSGSSVVFSQGRLTYLFGGVTLNGSIPNKDIVVGENVLTRYLVPMAILFIVLLAAAIYVRRMVSATARASPQ